MPLYLLCTIYKSTNYPWLDYMYSRYFTLVLKCERVLLGRGGTSGYVFHFLRVLQQHSLTDLTPSFVIYFPWEQYFIYSDFLDT